MSENGGVAAAGHSGISYNSVHWRANKTTQRRARHFQGLRGTTLDSSAESKLLFVLSVLAQFLRSHAPLVGP